MPTLLPFQVKLPLPRKNEPSINARALHVLSPPQAPSQELSWLLAITGEGKDSAQRPLQTLQRGFLWTQPRNRWIKARRYGEREASMAFATKVRVAECHSQSRSAHPQLLCYPRPAGLPGPGLRFCPLWC